MAIVINQPTAGSSVAVPFTAYGTIDGPTMNVSGAIIYLGISYAGNTQVNGPNWQINFTKPTGTGLATLKVWCTDDTSVFSQETIRLVPPS